MRWWDVYELTPLQWARWRIGPLTLYAQSRGREWVFGWRTNEMPLDETFEVDLTCDADPLGEGCKMSRYVADHGRPQLRLKPLLADRPIVVQPDKPLFVLPEQEIVLFVTTVVWVAAVLEGDRTLLEVPALRPSDTWFGPNTMQGELCYSSRTSARTDTDTLGAAPHRAATPVEIRNHGTDTLQVEQLRVPVPALALYQDERERLWTDAVSFAREHDDRQAALTIPKTSTHLPPGRVALARPRAPVAAGIIVHAFSRLLW